MPCRLLPGGLQLAVALCLSLPAMAQYEGVPFSHKKHLGLSLECVGCHEGAKTSEKAGDVLLPSGSVCTQCHAPAPVKEPAELLVTKFNHKLHNSIPNINQVILAAIRSGDYLAPASEELVDRLQGAEGCGACHRGLVESEAVTKAVFPHMADCLVCHSDIEPPFSCEKCHDASAELMPASHTPDYLESHSRPGALRETDSCAICHGREFTCLGCH